jgi:MurNAc alpha-1-phosphate uridylyltransferase
MKAMILAAGKGERMRPLTETTPKPLLRVGGKRLIEYHLERLARHGFTDIVINTSWLGDQIPEALGDGSAWGLNIAYSHERPDPLETAGGIAHALHLLGPEPFLIINGDIWCDYEPQADFTPGEQLAHLIMVNNPAHNPRGDFALQGGLILNEEGPRYTFSGIGYYQPAFFEGVATDAPAPLAPLLRRAAGEGKISGELFDGEWLDIGTPERLAELNASLATS